MLPARAPVEPKEARLATNAVGAPVELANRRQRRLPIFIASGVAFVILLASFLENDRRGLLLFSEPSAFAVAEEAEPTELLIGGAGRTFGPPSARRLVVERRQSVPGPVTIEEDSAAGVGGAPIQDPIGLGPAAPIAAPALALGGPVPGGGGPGIPPFGDPGGGVFVPLVPIPTGPGPVDPPDDPGVILPPAVPEPAAWLLMILGVGALGAAMRMRRYLAGRGRMNGAPVRA